MKLKTLTTLIGVLTLCTTLNAQECERIFISEYVVGTGNNKAIEIYNPTNEPIDLDGYVLERWSNGEQFATDALDLEGIIPAFGTWVITHGQTEDIILGSFIVPACDPELQALADQLDSPEFPAPTFLNGNDALVLVNYSVSPPVFDIFGKPGQDPGAGWRDPDFNVITASQTLVRKAEVTAGVILPPVEFLPLDEWIPIGLDNWTNLGTHECDCEDELNISTFSPPYINEFDDDSDWTLINEGEQGTWDVVIEQDADLVDYMGEMESPTANNGFAEFNGIIFLLEEDVKIQNSILELNDVIDCSDLEEVQVRFNQRARAFNYDENFLEVSGDNGVSWVSFLLNDELVVNQVSVQGEIELDVSEVAAGQEFVKVRFRWVCDPLSQAPDLSQQEVNMFGSGYGWMVDDLFITSRCDLSIDLGDTLSFCNQGELLYVGSEFTSYAWNTGDTTSTIEVNTSGDYFVEVFDTLGCRAVDSVHVELLLLDILQPDTTISIGQSIVLEADVNGLLAQKEGCNDLFISEIYMGPDNDKAIEIFNPTPNAIDLQGYVLERWEDGAPFATDFLELEGLISSYGTWLIVNGQVQFLPVGGFASQPCDPELQALADQLDNPTYPAPLYLNGNDALVLTNNNLNPPQAIDIFGKPGENPGQGWETSSGSFFTDEGTFVRKFEINNGVKIIPDEFLPSDEWGILGFENRANLGLHQNACSEAGNTIDQLSYLWSTGETTPTIEVSPSENTTYSVSVDNGIITCSDSVTVSLSFLCNVEGGILEVTEPLNKFCIGDNAPNFFTVQVSGNTGVGRYGVVDANSFDIIGGSSTGTFNFENYPEGDYLVGYVSYSEPDFFVGKENVSDLEGCFDLSNLVGVSTYELQGGEISADQPTTFCLGQGAPNSINFSVSGEAGPNFRWVLLNTGFTEVIRSNQSGVFFSQNFEPGVYKVVRAVYGDEVAIGEVDPQDLVDCVDLSNIVTLVLLDCGGLVNLQVQNNPVNTNSTVAFSSSEGAMALLEIYDVSGRMIRSVYNGYAEEAVEYRIDTDLSDLSNGVYLYRLTTDETVVTEKFVVSR